MTESNAPKDLSIVSEKFSLVPRNLTEAMEFAKLMANSELVPKDYFGKPGNVLAAVQMGLEVGLSPMQSVQNIAVINGRPTIWGDAVKGLVQASGHLEYCVETWDAKTLTATCKVKRRDKPERVATFSLDDAKRAGLAAKQTYQQYPQRMCAMRARSWALRDEFADVLKGLAVREEVEDYEIVHTTPEGTDLMRPKAKSGQTVDEFVKPAGHAEPNSAAVQDAPKSATGTTWTGKLANVETKKGTTKQKDGSDKPYTLYTILGADGWKCATFSDTDADLARSIIARGDDAEIAYEEGKYGPKLKSIQPLAIDVPAADEPGANG